MMSTGIDLDGLENLTKKINELGIAGARSQNKALRAGGDVLQKAIMEKAPRSDHPRLPTPTAPTQSWRTGEHAADNIKKTRIKTVDGAKVIDVGITRGDTSHYFYLKFFEFGTSKMKARPFMAPAAEESQSEVLRAISDELKRGLKL